MVHGDTGSGGEAMRLAFLHVDIPGQEMSRTLAEIMVASAKRVMPDLEVVQLTNIGTPEIKGVDSSIRKKIIYPFLMQYRLSHFKDFPGDAIFIDTDTVILRDLRPVFEKQFDVALTRRTGRIIVDGKDIVPEQPFNTGVMFSRNPAFWSDVFDCCWKLNDDLKHWYGDQMSVKVVVDSGKFNILELPCFEYNYSPKRPGEDLTGKYVAHYKGEKRKAWMIGES